MTATLADPRQLLGAWEAAVTVPGCAVGAVLWHGAGGTADLGAALDLPLSVLAVALARLQVDTFGPVLDAVTSCQACAEDLEVCLPVTRFAALAAETATARVSGSDGPLVVRCPTTRDLVAVAETADPATALLSRCLAGEDGGLVDVTHLDAATREAVESAAQRLAGPAAALVTIRCPACDQEVQVDLDLAGLLWQRVRSAVPVVLADVADLAAAFGWTEADVLALTPLRRAAYLELARGAS